MQGLARTLIEHWWWILRCEEELKTAFDDDFMLDHYVGVQSTLEDLSPEERQAVRTQAAALLNELLAVDEWGFSKRSEVTPARREFFDYVIDFPEPGAETEDNPGG